MAVNRLKLNAKKLMCMLIGSQQKIDGKILLLNGSILKPVSSTKYLGVYIHRSPLNLAKSY